MALLRTEAERLSNNMLVAGMVETIITEDPLFSLLDFRQINSKAYVYNRELALPGTQFRAPGDTINESSGKTEEVMSRIRGIIGDVDVDNFLDETMGDTNSQKGIQIGMKVKATGRVYRDNFINGAAYAGTITSGNPGGNFLTAVTEVSDANGEGVGTIALDVTANTLRYTAPNDTEGAGAPVTYAADGAYFLPSGSPSKWIRVSLVAANEGGSNASIVITSTSTKSFTGLKYLVPETQIKRAGTNGAALSFDLLDELVDMVRGVPVDAIIMPKRTIRAYKALLRTAGGTESAQLMLPGYGGTVLTYDGKPILPNEFISTSETMGNNSATTSIYAVSLDPEVGIQGLYGGPEAGIRVVNVGELETKDATRTRVKWYCGTALKSQLAVARLSGITN